MSSHRTVPDCFNHRALGLSPRPLLWLARVTGYLLPNHRRTALGSPKAKTPQDALWSWLLARATARRLNRPKASLAIRQDHTVPCGVVVTGSSSRCHSRRFELYMIFLSCKPLRLQVLELAQPQLRNLCLPLADRRLADAQKPRKLTLRACQFDKLFFCHCAIVTWINLKATLGKVPIKNPLHGVNFT